jgi:hypothetical protein
MAAVELVTPDELKTHRHTLKNGLIIVDFSPPTNSNGTGGGVSVSRHIYVSSDFESLVLKDTTKKSLKGGRRVPLKLLRVVNKGLGPGHYQKLLSGKLKPVADPNKSLFITSIKAEEAIYIECISEAERDRCVSAYKVLLTAYRHQQSLLSEILT